jgi:hypothetical protein
MTTITMPSVAAVRLPARILSALQATDHALKSNRNTGRGLMPRLSEEQIKKARSVDLLSYLQTYEPSAIRKCGADTYCLREHDSFKMSNGKWYWFSHGFGGRSCLDYLVKVQGMGFVDAVQFLSDGAAASYREIPYPKVHSPPKPKKPFTLPKANINNDRVIAYLRGRGISKNIINRCIGAGILYESAYTHRCVFVGKDGAVPKFACERGTDDGTKRDISGSSKCFSFHLPPDNPNSRNLVITESPIDALAHYCINDIGQTGWDGHRLSLGGFSSLALTAFLERNPKIQNIYFALDNDNTGKEAANRIIRELLNDKRYSHIKITVSPPPIGKDYADTLQAIHRLNIEKSKPDRQKAAVSI